MSFINHKKLIHRKISNIWFTKSQILNDSHLVLQLSVPNPLKPGVLSDQLPAKGSYIRDLTVTTKNSTWSFSKFKNVLLSFKKFDEYLFQFEINQLYILYCTCIYNTYTSLSQTGLPYGRGIHVYTERKHINFNLAEQHHLDQALQINYNSNREICAARIYFSV